MQQGDARRQFHRFLHVMRHEYRSLAEIGAQPQEFALQIETRDRVQRAERFVEKQNLRIGGERPRHTHALPLSAGELTRKSLREIGGKADALEQFAIRAP